MTSSQIIWNALAGLTALLVIGALLEPWLASRYELAFDGARRHLRRGRRRLVRRGVGYGLMMVDSIRRRAADTNGRVDDPAELAELTAIAEVEMRREAGE